MKNFAAFLFKFSESVQACQAYFLRLKNLIIFKQHQKRPAIYISPTILSVVVYCYLLIADLHETRSCNKGFELTNFYVWFRPALSYLWDIEHFCSGKNWPFM